MRGYLEIVIEKMQQMTAYIDNFDASLAQVAINYGEEADSISSTISTDASNVEGVKVETTTGVSGFAASDAGGSGAAGGSGSTTTTSAY